MDEHDGPQIFMEPDKIISDLNKCVRFKIPEKAAELAVKVCVQILVGQDVQGSDGPRPPRAREIQAAVRSLVAMERVNQGERATMATLLGVAAQVQASLDVKRQTAQHRERDELENDFVARIAAECKQTMDALREGSGPEAGCESGDAGEDPLPLPGNGNGGP